ncbi:MAG: BON domain-containing protein [Chloroflexi bacterium]|nr:BON domain-containing protein [Chloroflexota bacterium]
MQYSRRPYPSRPRDPRTFYMGPWGPFHGPSRRDDAAVKHDVEDLLFYDGLVDSLNVNVNVSDGVVTLTGTVSSANEKWAAEDDAWAVPFVKDVKNNLQVS